MYPPHISAVEAAELLLRSLLHNMPLEYIPMLIFKFPAIGNDNRSEAVHMMWGLECRPLLLFSQVLYVDGH